MKWISGAPTSRGDRSQVRDDPTNHSRQCFVVIARALYSSEIMALAFTFVNLAAGDYSPKPVEWPKYHCWDMPISLL